MQFYLYIIMENQEKDNKSKVLLYVIIGVLFITNLLLFYQWKKGSDGNEVLSKANTDLTSETTRLGEELDALTAELDLSKASMAQKDETIANIQTELESKVAQLRSALSKGNLSNAELTKFRNEIKALKTESENLQNRIKELEEELNLTKQDLSETNTKLTNEVQNTERLKGVLTQKEEVISKGKQLIADQMSVTGVKIKGSGKEVETTRTRKADAIRVSFRIIENKIADKGDKPLYVKITGPNGVTLEPVTGDGVFSLSNGESAKYTVLKIIDYKNGDMIVDVYHKSGSDYEKGNYTVEVFADKVSIGKSAVTLR